MMKYINKISYWPKEIVRTRYLIYELIKREFQSDYMGSYLGFIWVFIGPLMFIGIIVLVFSLGIRGGVSGDVPFIVYLVSGMVAWLFFADCLVSCTTIILKYSYLIKKVDVHLVYLPIIKIISASFPHLFLVIMAIIIAQLNGYSISIYILQLFYFLVSMFVLLFGISLLTSSIYLFINDVSKITALLATFGFWLTPVFWNINRIPENYQWIVKLNPVYYIVSGYRDSIIYEIPFWDRGYEMLYFWSITLSILIIGIRIYSRLRPHFAEVV